MAEAEQAKRKKRVRNFTPSDRAQHRILEKERREAFNAKMMELAHSLPRLSNTRQISKHVIVRESIRQHSVNKTERTLLLQGVKSLLAERDDLLAEVNRWRSGQTQLEIRGPSAVDPAVLRLVRPKDSSAADDASLDDEYTDHEPEHDAEHEHDHDHDHDHDRDTWSSTSPTDAQPPTLAPSPITAFDASQLNAWDPSALALQYPYQSQYHSQHQSQSQPQPFQVPWKDPFTMYPDVHAQFGMQQYSLE